MKMEFTCGSPYFATDELTEAIYALLYEAMTNSRQWEEETEEVQEQILDRHVALEGKVKEALNAALLEKKQEGFRVALEVLESFRPLLLQSGENLSFYNALMSALSQVSIRE